MSPAADSSVRTARPGDAADLAAMQVRAWLDAYAGELADETLRDLAGGPDEHTARWRESAADPPTPRHHVLVALAGDTAVGFAALAPSDDDDADPATDGEIVTFVVDPPRRREGHGSRLLAASVDHLRADGSTRGLVWIDATDEAGRALLTSAGWAPDGSFRTLDLRGDGGVVLREVRLHTDLTGAGA